MKGSCSSNRKEGAHLQFVVARFPQSGPPVVLFSFCGDSTCVVVCLQLEDCALQLYKYNGGQGDFGTYLDLESSLEEQWDELEGFTEQ